MTVPRSCTSHVTASSVGASGTQRLVWWVIWGDWRGLCPSSILGKFTASFKIFRRKRSLAEPTPSSPGKSAKPVVMTFFRIATILSTHKSQFSAHVLRTNLTQGHLDVLLCLSSAFNNIETLQNTAPCVISIQGCWKWYVDPCQFVNMVLCTLKRLRPFQGFFHHQPVASYTPKCCETLAKAVEEQVSCGPTDPHRAEQWTVDTRCGSCRWSKTTPLVLSLSLSLSFSLRSLDQSRTKTMLKGFSCPCAKLRSFSASECQKRQPQMVDTGIWHLSSANIWRWDVHIHGGNSHRWVNLTENLTCRMSSYLAF